MKKLFSLLFFGLVCLTSAQTQPTAAQWQEDLKFFSETIHNEYSFLFKKTTAEEFDAAVAELHDNIPDMELHEIIVGFSRLVASFKYGHTQLGFRGMPFKMHQLPMNLYQFQEGVYIQGVHKDYENALGARIVAVAGKPMAEVIEAVYPVVPAENSQYFKSWGYLHLISPEILHAQGVIPELSTAVTMTLEKDGETFDVTFESNPPGVSIPTSYGLLVQDDTWLDVRDQSETPLYLKNLDKIYYYEYLPEHKTVYVRHSQIQDDPSESIPDFYTRVFEFIENNDVERLVLDVRLNSGGNNYKNKAVVTRIIQSEKINQTGKLFVIIGRRTFSACQNLVNELHSYTNAVFIGEPSSENINFYGDNRRVDLPNSKLPIYLSFAWWQDKPQWENGDWTAPHLAVEMSFEEFKTNQDPVLDAALSFSESNYILDPMQYMTDLFLAGEMEKLGQETMRMVHDPAYRFFDFEKRLNQAGYQLLSSSQFEQAIAVFSFITQLFPESPNAWDSLAEGYLRAGQTEKAIELYNKAIALDADDGPTARNAKAMLKSISETH